MSSIFSSLRPDTIRTFAAATQRARSNFMNSKDATGNESAVVFDEFGAFEQSNAQHYVIETNESETDSDIEDEEESSEEIRRISEQMQNRNLPTQTNSPGMKAVKAAAPLNAAPENRQSKEHPREKTSPKTVAKVDSSNDYGHARNATDPLSSAALSRMRYYRKLVPAPKFQNTSPKSEPRPSSHLSTASPSSHEARFFPSSHSASALLFYHGNRSAPIAIPTKKLSPTSDSSHRFRGADIHPRITADSSFILPAASYLPSALQKSFVPLGDGDESAHTSGRIGREKRFGKDEPSVRVGDKDDQLGFEFEMDM